MKKRIIIFGALALFAIGIISSCKKDPDPNNNGQNNDTIPTVTDRIVFGDTTGMIVTTYNTVMEFDDGWNPIILDLNGGGIDDIKIETVYDGPLAIGEFQALTLYCLNDRIELLGDSLMKESYSHRDTTITINNDWTIKEYGYTFSTCNKVDENDQVNHTKMFELKANDANEHLSINDHFQSIEINLFRENMSHEFMDYLNEEEQYVIYSYNKYIYDCWNFPTDEEKYIGFKFTINGKSRLGWLKIKLHPTWGGSVVNTELIETAIQK